MSRTLLRRDLGWTEPSFLYYLRTVLLVKCVLIMAIQLSGGGVKSKSPYYDGGAES